MYLAKAGLFPAKLGFSSIQRPQYVLCLRDAASGPDLQRPVLRGVALLLLIVEHRVTGLLLDVEVGFLYMEHTRKTGPMLVQLFFFIDSTSEFPYEEHMSIRAHACFLFPSTEWRAPVSRALTHIYMEGMPSWQTQHQTMQCQISWDP